MRGKEGERVYVERERGREKKGGVGRALRKREYQ